MNITWHRYQVWSSHCWGESGAASHSSFDLLSKVYEVLHPGTTYKIEKFNKMILGMMHKIIYGTSNFAQDINGFSQFAAYIGWSIV